MKLKATSIFIVLLGPLLAGTPGCDNSGSEVEPQYHKITAMPNADCRIDVKEQETAGEEVLVTVTLLNQAVEIASVTYNDTPCEARSEGGGNGAFVYAFTMPDRAVTLVVNTRTQEPGTYAITVTNGQFHEIFAPERAESGQTVAVTVAVNQTFFKIGSLLYNDQPCTYLSDDGVEYKYEFTMPAREVHLTATVDEDLHLITPIQGEHTSLIILNCHYNFGTPDHLIQCSQFGIVRVLYEADLGYEAQCAARAESGQTLEMIYNPTDADYGPCWWIEMPDEPITIETTATEKELYAGKDFVGTYLGFELYTPESRLVSGTAPALTMELRANTAFTVISTDRNAFDFDGIYTYDEAADEFTYVREYCKKIYAVSGRRVNGEMFIQTNNLLEDRPDNNRYYFTGEGSYAYTCASDSFNKKFLLEIRRNATATYYYVDLLSYTWNQVDASFDDGSTIAETCSALISLDGTPLFRYTLHEGETPLFTLKGKEAGTYRLLSGTGPDLTLDGFGGASVGEQTGTYTIENGIVDFNAVEKQAKYLIDPIHMTYYEVASDQAWDGPTHLYAESAYGYNSSVSSDWIKGWVYLDMDCDIQGNPKPRYARIKLKLPDMFGRQLDIVSDAVPYIYDPQSGTLVLSQVAQGRTDGWGQVRRDIAFTVTEQKTVVFTTEKVASMSSPNQYIYTLGLELSPAPDPAQ